jgi:hypothetical protein
MLNRQYQPLDHELEYLFMGSSFSKGEAYHIFIIMVELTIGFDDLNAFF